PAGCVGECQHTADDDYARHLYRAAPVQPSAGGARFGDALRCWTAARPAGGDPAQPHWPEPAHRHHGCSDADRDDGLNLRGERRAGCGTGREPDFVLADCGLRHGHAAVGAAALSLKKYSAQRKIKLIGTMGKVQQRGTMMEAVET